jgi:dolichol-phosphate mannosyltransferase
LDADLQDPPELLPLFIEKWHKGYKVVYGIRRSRHCGLIKAACYKAFYYLLNRCSDIDIPRDAGDFCLMDRQVLDVINTIQEYKPFVRGMRAWVGFAQAHVVYDRPDRLAGKTSYSWLHLFKLALDGFLSFTDVFLLWASILSFAIAFIIVLFSFWIMGNQFLSTSEINGLFGSSTVWTNVICIITLLIGLIFIFLGLLGKYVGRIFMHTKQRPLYVVQEVHGLGN